MSYLQRYIPACEAFGWNGGPEFKTRIRVTSNGRERRNADWAQARSRFSLPFQNIDAEDYAGLRQMFEVCRGALHAFLYRDPLGYVAEDQVFAIADGRDTYQLTTLSTLDGVSYQHEVYALYTPTDDGDAIPSTIEVTVNGVVTSVVVDHERGLVAFSPAPAPGAVLAWSGAYSLWVRFVNDWLPFSIDNRRGQGYALNGSVDLLELPGPELVET